MAKKSRSGNQPNPAIRLSNLGPRAKQLFGDTVGDPPRLSGELDRLTDGLKPSSFLPLLVNALTTIPDAQRVALNLSMSEWLRQHELVELLHSLEAQHTFKEPTRSIVRALLVSCGISFDLAVVVNPADLFLAAFELGGPSQDSPAMFWYEDERRRRVYTASFLVDFEPPWDGALKDIAFNRHPNFNEAVSMYRTTWRMSGLVPQPIDATTVAQRIWKALRQSQVQGIRLPADFITILPKVMPFLNALPVGRETVPLSAAEVEALLTTGRSPESIRHEERAFGYQTRMPDGKILRILRSPDDEPF